MAAQAQPDRDQYRLIITRRGATEVLLSTHLSGWSLPRLGVHADRRPAEQLTAGIKMIYGFGICCLLIVDSVTERSGNRPARSVVMEAVRQENETPAGTRWLSLDAAKSHAALAAEDQAAIRSSLEEIDRYIAKPEMGPFARPAWIVELLGWVQEHLKPLGLQLTGDFEQFNAGPTFSLVRIATTGAAVWFKATGEPNRHELPITIALHHFFPAYMPRILAVHPKWNAWLSEEAPGATLDGLNDVRTWAKAAHALAELQIASIAKTDELLKSGCIDLRLHMLTEQIDPFLARMNQLMTMQSIQPPQIVSPSELRFLGDSLRAAFCELEQQRIPSTLGHLDFNPGNILASPVRCSFLDWAEGCVTHPFLTFEYLREHARRTFARDPTATQKIVRAYIRPWQSIFPPETVTNAMVLSPLVAVFVFAVAGKRWCSPDTFQNPKLAGYFRSLTRRAYREATQMTARSDRCLA
jgi:hypothetical protein